MSRLPLNLGARVRIKIARPAQWARGAREILDGLTGVVEAYSPTNYLGFDRADPYLVRFDPHTRGHWNANTYPKDVAAFHFALADLEPLS